MRLFAPVAKTTCSFGLVRAVRGSAPAQPFPISDYIQLSIVLGKSFHYTQNRMNAIIIAHYSSKTRCRAWKLDRSQLISYLQKQTGSRILSLDKSARVLNYASIHRDLDPALSVFIQSA